MKKTIYLALIASFLSMPAFAKGDIAAGKAKAAVCASCHGADGITSIPGYPNLAGQNEQYLVTAMKAYKSGERTGATATIMRLQMQVLNNQDIENLAAYYANMK
jgi:cytochrome c553